MLAITYSSRPSMMSGLSRPFATLNCLVPDRRRFDEHDEPGVAPEAGQVSQAQAAPQALGHDREERSPPPVAQGVVS